MKKITSGQAYLFCHLNSDVPSYRSEGLNPPLFQAGSSLTGAPDVEELKNFIGIASAMTNSSRKRSRDTTRDTTRASNFQKMSRKAVGNSFDPNDKMEAYVTRAEAVFSHTVSKSKQVLGLSN